MSEEKLYLAGDPLPTNDAGEIIPEALTDAQREELAELTKDFAEKITPQIKKLAGTFSRIRADKGKGLLDSLLGDAAPIYREITGELAPYISKELQKPEYNGATLPDLLSEYKMKDLAHLPADSVLQKVIEAARTAKADAEAENARNIGKYEKLRALQMNIDKNQMAFFDVFAPKKNEIAGQISFLPAEGANTDGFYEVGYERKGQPETTLLYRYDFDDAFLDKMGLQKSIDYEDFFILTFMFNNYLQGNPVFTPTKIYRDMTGAEPKGEEEAIIKSAYKMLGTVFSLDEREVLAAWGKPQPDKYRIVSEPLAPIRITEERYKVNGGLANCKIEMLAEPLIFKTGRTIGQYTTIPISIFAVKKENGRQIRRTKRYWKMLYYLIKRIAQIKDGKQVNKILYDTFYKDMGCKSARDRQLTNTMLFTILDHFKREGWINGYKEETTKSTGAVGLKFSYTANKKELPGAKKRRKAKK